MKALHLQETQEKVKQYSVLFWLNRMSAVCKTSLAQLEYESWPKHSSYDDVKFTSGQSDLEVINSLGFF